jgi:hypothetical protein
VFANAQPGSDPGHQFGEPERLGDVVVGASIQADDDVRFLCTRGQHDDGKIWMLGSYLAAHIETVDVGQGEIEEDKVESDFVASLQRWVASGDVNDVEIFRSQDSDERFTNSSVIFNEQNCGHGDLFVCDAQLVAVHPRSDA